MPRLPRFNLVDVPQHVIQRGNNRQARFFEPDDYRFYLDWLNIAADNAGCDVHAYVLMTNHVHISVNQRVVLGGDTFREQIEAALDVRTRPGRRGRPPAKRE